MIERTHLVHTEAVTTALQDEIHSLTIENIELQNALRATEDDLTAARTGL